MNEIAEQKKQTGTHKNTQKHDRVKCCHEYKWQNKHAPEPNEHQLLNSDTPDTWRVVRSEPLVYSEAVETVDKGVPSHKKAIPEMGIAAVCVNDFVLTWNAQRLTPALPPWTRRGVP